jgi:hypothetical protein
MAKTDAKKNIRNFLTVQKMAQEIIKKHLDDEILNQLSEEQWDNIISGNITLNIKLSIETSKNQKGEEKKQVRQKASQKQQSNQKPNFEEIKSKLETMDDRDKGIVFIKEACPTNTLLKEFAKFAGITLVSKKKDEMCETIVNRIIGSRLTNQVFQHRSQTLHKSANDLQENINNDETQTIEDSQSSETQKTDDINDDKQEQNQDVSNEENKENVEDN